MKKKCSISSGHSMWWAVAPTRSMDLTHKRLFPQKRRFLHLLNRKFIKDIDALYGDYQAGAELGQRPPIVDFTKEDAEPNEAVERGNEHA